MSRIGKKPDRLAFNLSGRASCRRDFIFQAVKYKAGQEFPHIILDVQEHRLRNLHAARFIDFVPTNHQFPPDEVPLIRRGSEEDKKTPVSVPVAAPVKAKPGAKKAKPAKPKSKRDGPAVTA